MKTEETVHRIQQLRADADAFDDIGPCAWDEADSRRAQAKLLESQLPHFDVVAIRIWLCLPTTESGFQSPRNEDTL